MDMSMAKQTESKDNIAMKAKDRWREAIVLGGSLCLCSVESL